MSQSDNYNLLIQKLDQFIRKHYLNQVLRGLIVTFAIIIGVFVVLNVVEYNYFLSTMSRKFLFFGFIALCLGTAGLLIINPLLRYYKLGKVISHEQAALIIGKHFSDVKDKLLNVLQLHRQSEQSGNRELILASINQKIDGLQPIPFASAIDLSGNRKYLKYLAAPLLLFLIILFAAPNVIKDGTTRLVYNNQDFEKPSPFTFNIKNEKLEAIQFEDFELNVEVTGDVLPEQVFIKQEGYAYKMRKLSPSSFRYSFINLQEDVTFVFSASGFDSKPYQLHVLPKPMIVNFSVSMDYPAYTKRKDERLTNIGDLTIPEGTAVQWEFNTRHTEKINLKLDNELIDVERRGDALFTTTQTPNESGQYVIKVSSKDLVDADSINYSISVVKDQYPSIKVKAIEDSVSKSYLYFVGEIGDDYGLNSLYLKYKLDNGAADSKYNRVPVSFERSGHYSQFNHFWDLKSLNLSPGDNLTYFFEVWDNDQVNGPKSSRSTMQQFRLPTLDEIDEQTNEDNQQVKDKLEENIEKASEIKEEISALQEKLFQKKNLNWEDKKSIQDLLEKQKELENSVEDMKETFSESVEKQQEFKNVKEEILKKQQKLQELFDEVLSDEMKELFEKLESMLEEMEQDELLENLDDFELSEEQLEEELDRMLSLFKQLEFEQKLSETIDKLDQLAKEQEKLSKETEEKSSDSEELAEKQEEINEKFENIEKGLEDLEDINKELGKESEELSEQQEQAQDVKQDMQESQENISKGKNKKASESQKSAAKKMQEMSENLAQMMNSMQMEQMEMDMRAIRQLLENLVTLSFDQEDLIEEVNTTHINAPSYVDLVQKQYKLKDDTKLVKDSLFALSKRVFQLETFINKEITEVQMNLEKSINRLEDRKKPDAARHQQYVMTGYNNLALMLSETMDQMQQQMASQMPGQQNCQSGQGKGMPKPTLSQMQKGMNEQLSKMQEQMKKGKQPGGKGGMSKEMAKTAAQQAAIREALKKMNEEENGDGSLGNLNELIDEMDKTETELVNKQLTEQMYKRQQEILTRLLEAEDAMREREYDKKRESEIAQELAKKVPPSLEEYLKQREAEIQLYKTVPPTLKPYYRQLVENYFKNISF